MGLRWAAPPTIGLVSSSRQRHSAAIGIIVFGCLAVVCSVVGIAARQGAAGGVIGLLGIALVIRGLTLRARLKREEAIPPGDHEERTGTAWKNGLIQKSEFERTKDVLRAHGVAGSEDFGTFVNDTRYFAPSRFDGKAAIPVLMGLLPTLGDERVVATVARHLDQPSARPEAYGALLQAFQRWAAVAPDSDAGWALGKALATASTASNLPQLLVLAADPQYGRSRQMIVFALYRFKTDDTAAVLKRLIRDPEVALHAMSALRRVIGAEKSRALIEAVAIDYEGSPSAAAANRELKKIDKRLASLGAQTTAEQPLR